MKPTMVSPGQLANRRLMVYLLAAAGIIVFIWVNLSSGNPTNPPMAYSNTPIHHVTVAEDTLQGGSIAPKLGNETLKYVLPHLPPPD